MPTSAGPPSRTALVRRHRGRRWFSSTEPTWGYDHETSMGVQIDPTGWVLDLRLDELPPSLRTAEGLYAGLRRAIGNATLAHVAARAQQRRLTTQELSVAREHLSGRRPTKSRIPAPAPMTYPTGPVQAPGVPRDERVSRTWSGGSREGEIVVVMTAIAGLRALEASADFLARTDAATVRFALREAFADAAHERPGASA